jgi:hypothetical protein
LSVNIINSVQRRQRQTQRSCDLERSLYGDTSCVKQLSDWIKCCHFHCFVPYESYINDFQHPTILYGD